MTRDFFVQLARKVFAARKPREHLLLNLSGEQSQFIRLSQARVRQTGTVEDLTLTVTLVLEGPEESRLRRCSRSCTLTGLTDVDHDRAWALLDELRSETPDVPVDPYATIPKNPSQSRQEEAGRLPPVSDAVDALLGPARGTDLAGIFASGRMVRAMATSAGHEHWFATESFCLDYSLYTSSQRAVKGAYAGRLWDDSGYRAQMENSVRKLGALERAPRKIERGAYRAYLEPAAFADLLHMLSWEGVSEAAIRQGASPLRLMRAEGRKFSPLFELAEDFSAGWVPRFNDEGDLSPERLTIVGDGELKNSLVSTRTALEYGLPSNGADEDETLRSPRLAPGRLLPADALRELGTGLYLSNLHYLNWSDQPGGRVTGMTRYACFWVENGEIRAPIENLRFDDSIFDLFGARLEALTTDSVRIPETGTYHQRALGGVFCPGALIRDMKFTL